MAAGLAEPIDQIEVTRKEAADCRWYARVGVAIWGIGYYLLLIGSPTLSVLLTGIAAYHNVDPANINRAGGEQGTQQNIPVTILIVSGLVSLFTILGSALTPVEKYTRHLLFRNSFNLFIATFDQERNLVILRTQENPAQEQALAHWRILKATELARIKNAWDEGSEKPPEYSALDLDAFIGQFQH